MPIKAEKKDLYPWNWAAIAREVKDAAGWKCELCGQKHDPATPGCTLTVHHRDRNPENNTPYNLVAACQRCHLSMEAKAKALERRDLIEEEQITMDFI